MRIEAEPTRASLWAAVQELLAAREAIVLVLDDVHRFDRLSLEALGMAQATLDASCVLVLATLRDQPSTEDDLLNALRRAALEIPLGPLSVAEMAEWTGPAAPADLYERSRGNPLFVDGLLRAGGGGRLPSDVHSVLAHRLASLTEPARRLVAEAALLGRPFASGLLLGAGWERDDLVRAIDEAQSEAILVETEPGWLGLAHPLLREVALALAPAVLRDAHLRLSRALLRLYADDPHHQVEIAQHQLAAAPLGGPDTLDRALRAASEARQMGDHGAAANLLGRAVDALPWFDAVDRRLGLLLDRGEAELAAGHRSVARAIAVQAAALAREAADPEALGRAALLFASSGEFGAVEPERYAILEEAVAAARGPAQVRLLARLARERWCDLDAAGRRDEESARAVALAGEDRALRFEALAARVQAIWGPARLDERRSAVTELWELAGEEPERRVEVLRHRLNLWCELGDLARIRADLGAYEVAALQSRRPQLVFNAKLRRAMLAPAEGRFDDALAESAELRTLGAAADDPQTLVITASRDAIICAQRLDQDRFARIERILAVEAERVPHLGIYGMILAYGRMLLGDPAGARAALERWGEPALRAPGIAELPSLAMLSMVLAELVPDHPWVPHLRERLLPSRHLHVNIGATWTFGSVQRYLGLLDRLIGDTGRARRRLSAALQANEGLPVWSACTMADLAPLLEPGPARALRDRALADADRLGLRALSVRLRAVAAPAAPAPAIEARFERAGDHWRLAYAGREVHLKDQRGMEHLATLLAAPRRPATALALAGVEEPHDRGLEVIDEVAVRAYRAELDALQQDLAAARQEGDAARRKRAQQRLEALGAELGRALGVGGAMRTTGSTAERTRSAVTKAIHRAIAKIAEVHPQLGRHLTASIRTGSSCVYTPEADVRWIV